MALTDRYVLSTGFLKDLFGKIQDAQAPKQFTQQYMKDLGFRSSNHMSAIPLLKALGFLNASGEPTKRYLDYRDRSKARAVLGEALQEAYGDLFTIKEVPTKQDKEALQGKFLSVHNCTDRVAELQTSTFLALIDLADLLAARRKSPAIDDTSGSDSEHSAESVKHERPAHSPKGRETSLHYNIQVHLPATKDVEVFNAIFKALKEHLLD